MKLIVGLGNPGEDYKLTRHNIGFMVLEEFARLHGVEFRFNRRFNAFTAEAEAGNEAYYLVMPRTFMNLSGNSVQLIVNWFKVELQNILVVIDDITLPFGIIRVRSKGSDAGHKGLRSVIGCLGINEFPRMRVGINSGRDIRDVSKYVLGRFTKNEQKVLPDILKRAGEACECWLQKGVSAVMNKYNKKEGEV